jgi:hypothetical protein
LLSADEAVEIGRVRSAVSAHGDPFDVVDSHPRRDRRRGP